MSGATADLAARRTGRVRRLRLLAVVLVLAGCLAYWQSTRPGASPVGDGFLGAFSIGDADWIAREVPSEAGEARFGVRPVDGGRAERFLTGRPVAVLGVRADDDDPGRLGVVFEDALSLSPVAERDARDWRVTGFESGFRARAAGLDRAGRVVVIGRDAEGAARVERIAIDSGERTPDPAPVVLPEGARIVGVDGERGAAIVWIADEGGVRVEAIALADGARASLATWEEEPRAFATSGSRIGWVDQEGALRVREADGTERVAADLAGGPAAGPVRLALGAGAVYVRSGGDVLAAGGGELRVVARGSTAVWVYLGYLFGWLGTMAALVAARDARPRIAGAVLAALPARLPRRLAAWGLDVFGLLLAVLFWASLSGRDPEQWLDGSASLAALVVDWELLNLFYFVVAESLFGSSLGKRAFGLRVVEAREGRPPGPLRSFLRNAVRFLDVRGGAALAILSPRRQRVGDWIARTMVVETYELPLRSSPDADDSKSGPPEPADEVA